MRSKTITIFEGLQRLVTIKKLQKERIFIFLVKIHDLKLRVLHKSLSRDDGKMYKSPKVSQTG